nr:MULTISPECIES: HAMP domain-containing sensor histidine kinase [unclassified Arthrobacter]
MVPLVRAKLPRASVVGVAILLVLTAAATAALGPSGLLAEEAGVLEAILVLALFVIYLLLRAWASDRAEVQRLRSIARRNADQISVVSHEIRTPLALMKGASDLLAEGSPGPLTASQTRFVETISSNCHSVIALAEDLLAQARMDAGMFTLHPQRVNLRTLSASVIAELRHLHGLPLALDCPGAPPRVWADPQLLRQALTNLINNAVGHAYNAKLITVRVVNADAQILISVSDDGDGIPDEERQQLFERFQSGRPLRDGTGLGLVITRAIVQMHGGDIFVDSTPKRGTTMLLSLPRETPQPAVTAGRNGALQ